MSDQTSDTSTGFNSEVAEPSMEDILASIRKIIAEDDNRDEGHIDIKTESDLIEVEAIQIPDSETITPEVQISESEVQVSDVRENSGDADILDLMVSDVLEQEDEVLADEVLDILDDDQENENSIFGKVLDLTEDEDGDTALTEDVLDLTSLIEEDDEVFDDDGASFNPVSSVMSELEGKLTTSDTLALTATDDVVLSNSDIEQDDLLLVSDNDDENILSIETEIITALDSLAEDEYGEDHIEIIDGAESVSAHEANDESDLDIVKSLIADLTDDSFLDDELETSLDVQSSDDVNTDSLSRQDQNKTEGVASEDILTLEDDENSILDEILDLTFDDEAQLELSDLEDDDDTVVAENTDEDSLLLQFAADLEAGANQPLPELDESENLNMIDADPEMGELLDSLLVETEEEPSTEDILNEIDLALAEVTEEADNSSELVVENHLELTDDDLNEQIEVPDNTELHNTELEIEEPEAMAKTARKEAILDEVTETAAAGAFADLAKAVEDKAVFTESGPRIGDLVQEALRPMLKEWLDENLKTIVERAVAKEVKRISSGK